MAVVFKLPDLGENITSAEVVSVSAVVGDIIRADQTLIEVETDKAVTDVPVPIGGKLIEIAVKVGDKLAVGDIIAKIEETVGAAPTAPAAAPSAASSSPAKAVDGHRARSPVCSRQRTPLTESATETTPLPEQVDVLAPDSDRPVPASPSVRKFAREIGVDISQVVGSGPAGRISMDDVKSFSRRVPAGGLAARPCAKHCPISASGARSIGSRCPTSARRPRCKWRRAGRRPHVTLHDKADVTGLEQFRQQYKGHVEQAGGKLTITAMLLRIVSAALEKFPALNCSIDMTQQEVVYKKYVNVGVAADTPRGLVVPVILNADQKTVTQLSVELTEMAARARSRQAVAGGDDRRDVHDHQSGRDRHRTLHADHQRSRSRYTGHRSQQLRTDLHGGPVPAAPDHAVESVVRSPDCGRRRRPGSSAGSWKPFNSPCCWPWKDDIMTDKQSKTQLLVSGWRTGWIPGRVSGGRFGHGSHPGRRQAESRRHLLVRGVYPLEDAVARGQADQRDGRRAQDGADVSPAQLDLDQLRKFKNGVVGKLTGGLGVLKNKRKVNFVRGRGVLVSATRWSSTCRTVNGRSSNSRT